MGLINTYNSISNEHSIIKASGKLKDILPNYDFKHTIFIKAGKRIDENYIVNDDDVLYCRTVPAEAATIGIIAIVTAVIAAGVGVGAAIYAKRQSEEAKKEFEKAQRDAQNLASAVQTLPFIKGAKNTSALGKTVQFLMGEMYNTPYNITEGFYSIDGRNGANSYYNAVLSCGYGNQKITEIFIGEETVKKDENGIHGLTTFAPGSLYDDKKSNRLEVRQAGEKMTLTNCNQKVVSTYSGAELKHEHGQDAEPVIVQAAENAQKIQVCIQFSCLRNYNSDDGEWEARTATVRPYWSNGEKHSDGSIIWHEFHFDGMGEDNSITINTNTTIRFVATKTFSPAESLGKPISIKVVKETAKAESGSQEDCALLWYQTFCYDAEKSTSEELVPCEPLEAELFNKCTRVAFRITASSSTDAVLDELHTIGTGYARVWNGSSWTTDKQPTRNPASWILEVLTSSIHSPSRYDDDEIDLNSLGALYEYCEENNFYTDTIICSEIKKRDIITNILSSVNADMILNNDGLLEFVIDKEEINPVALLNAENIKSITYAKEFNRKADGSKVVYTNRKNWQVDTFYAMLDGENYDYINDVCTDFAPSYVTEYEHAYKMAQRKLRQSQLMPREIKADVGLEGDYYPLYSTILLQLPELYQGLNSSVITSYQVENGLVKSITISDAVQFDSGKRYGIIIQTGNEIGSKILAEEVTSAPGKTRTLIIKYPFAEYSNYIAIGNHLSFGLLDSKGEFSKVTNTMKIYSIDPSGDEGYVLTLRDYNPAVYEYGGPIPAYKSNLTKKQAPNNTPTIDDINRVRQEMNTLQDTLIEAYQKIMMPIVVDADVKQAIFEIDKEGKTSSVQRITTNISCRQGNEDRDFVIGDVELPKGWTMAIVGNKITFSVGEGVKITSGQIAIPVIFRPVIEYDEYVDENGNVYVDENNQVYLENVLSSSSVTEIVYLSYFGLNEGVYLGPIAQVENIPDISNLNDYFTWSGTNRAVYAYTPEGYLLQGRLYKFVGNNKAWYWETDDNAEHIQAAISDVLGISNADLQNNNSKVYEYLDHLTTNSLYTQMIVANMAFIDALTSNKAFIDSITANNVFTNTLNARYLSVSMMEANKIKTQYLNVAEITAGLVKSQDLTAGNITVTGEINATSGTFSGREKVTGVFENSGLDILDGVQVWQESRISFLCTKWTKAEFISRFLKQRIEFINKYSYSYTTTYYYEKVGGFIKTDTRNLTVFCIQYIRENGKLADDRVVLLCHDASFNVYRAVLGDDIGELYSVSTADNGSYIYNISASKIANFNNTLRITLY